MGRLRGGYVCWVRLLGTCGRHMVDVWLRAGKEVGIEVVDAGSTGRGGEERVQA